MTIKSRQFRLTGLALTAALAGSALVGSSAIAQSPEPTGGTGSEQVVERVEEGELCTPAAYAGTGVEVIDLASATIGFAQSEKEANPFRIAETQSIKDEAAARGIDLITTNADSNLNKEISDIKSMVDQGADALIISPLNSEGLDEALEYARDAGVPVMTIDRFLTSDVFCDTYIGWVGSDFVEQGRRAAHAMIAASGGTGNLAILLGAAGVNVTDDRNAGFKEVLEAEAAAGNHTIELVAEQTANYVREEGQTVTEQLISANPDINLIYAHNDEMALGAVAALKGLGLQPGDVKIITIDGTHGRGPRHPRRLDLRRDRVQPALRSPRLLRAGFVLQRRGRPAGHDHQ